MDKNDPIYELYVVECNWNNIDPETPSLWYEMRDRFENIKAMNTIVKSINNEGAYYNHWIYIVPDCADDEDFMTIAFDEETFTDAVGCFKRLLQSYEVSKAGTLYIGDATF